MMHGDACPHATRIWAPEFGRFLCRHERDKIMEARRASMAAVMAALTGPAMLTDLGIDAEVRDRVHDLRTEGIRLLDQAAHWRLVEDGVIKGSEP